MVLYYVFIYQTHILYCPTTLFFFLDFLIDKVSSFALKHISFLRAMCSPAYHRIHTTTMILSMRVSDGCKMYSQWTKHLKTGTFTQFKQHCGKFNSTILHTKPYIFTQMHTHKQCTTHIFNSVLYYPIVI